MKITLKEFKQIVKEAVNEELWQKKADETGFADWQRMDRADFDEYGLTAEDYEESRARELDSLAKEFYEAGITPEMLDKVLSLITKAGHSKKDTYLIKSLLNKYYEAGFNLKNA